MSTVKEAHCEVYRQELPNLMNNMKLDEVLPRLYAQQVISTLEYEQVKSEKTHNGESKAVEKLFTRFLIKTKDPNSFGKLLKALKHSNQEELANCLDEQGNKYGLGDGQTNQRYETEQQPVQCDDRSGQSTHIDAVTEVDVVQSAADTKEKAQASSPSVKGSLSAQAGSRSEKTSDSIEASSQPLSGEIKIDTSEIDFKHAFRPGRYGSLFKYKHNNRQAVVKQVTIKTKKDEDLVNITSELERAVLIKHCNLVKFWGFDVMTTKYTGYLVYQILDGNNVEEIVFDDGLKKEYCLNREQKWAIGSQIAGALEYIHIEVGMVHGSIKSSNVLVKRESKDAFLCDFGMYQLKVWYNFTETTPTHTGADMYRAPECINPDVEEPVTKPADVFSFGVTLFELFTESELWDFGKERDAKQRKLLNACHKEGSPKLGQITDKEYKEVITACLAYDKTKRSTAAELVTMFNRV